MRGYLLMGAFELPDGVGEFWFATVDEAKNAALALGVQVQEWSEVTEVRQVRLRPR